ncbi:MAG: CinA family nicotinamide mononucleotide deamidase-related protein [Calditerrivibrio sp.]|nr:CinA family nicotinamide mononucleotide deamidase-related protein [Calditerrivibrio sp.]
MVQAAIVAIGSEIFTGSIVDTNSSYLAKRLTELGIEVNTIMPLPDDLERMVETFRRLLGENMLLFTTGGLGPTFDDLTAEGIAKATGRSLVFNEIAYGHILNLLNKRGVAVKDSHKRQAYLPEGAILLPNSRGTAMGFVCSFGESYTISMPGIPYEMKTMFENHVVPFIRDKFDIPLIFLKELKFTGVPESDVDDVVRRIGIPEGLSCIINVGKGEIVLRLKSFHEDILENFADRVVKSLEQFYLGLADDTLESILVKRLRDKNMSIAFVESCTGGLVSKKVTDVPGSSSVFKGSVVCYSNESKVDILGVPIELLERSGAVSVETVMAMLNGGKKLFKSDITAAITGIAGPTGGSEDKPVGLVYIALDILGEVEVSKQLFSGDRETIRERSCKYVFDTIIKKLRG